MRKIFYLILRYPVFIPYKWLWIRYYPHVIPDDEILYRWNRSQWPEYQQWIDKHSVLNRSDWQALHRQSDVTSQSASFTIVTPVHNTDERILEECILSVRMQTSPFWELILIDDASSRAETLEVLHSPVCQDPRIHILKTAGSSPSGISIATNLGIEQASGDYIVFLDHDDRLAPETITSLAQTLEQSPGLDILYSDRDMISPDEKRFMHLMKPDWSPENLLSGNYIFHLMCYHRKLIKAVGGLHSEFNGSQDYDLILRCMEQKPKVRHIRQVLYHWRQHVQSVAMNVDSKAYAFDAGIRALEQAMKRRGIRAKVTEDKSLWRGNYRVHLPLPDNKDIISVVLEKELPINQYRANVMRHAKMDQSWSYLLIRSEDYTEQSQQSISVLSSWLMLENLGMASAKALNADHGIIYAGMAYASNGQLFRPYCGYPADEPGYMAVTSILRNISLPNPFCVVIKRELWEQLKGFRECYHGPHALLDFAFRAQQVGWRIVYDPQAVFSCTENGRLDDFVAADAETFQRQWKDKLLAGDPCYSPNLSQHSLSYELNPD